MMRFFIQFLFLAALPCLGIDCPEYLEIVDEKIYTSKDIENEYRSAEIPFGKTWSRLFDVLWRVRKFERQLPYGNPLPLAILVKIDWHPGVNENMRDMKTDLSKIGKYVYLIYSKDRILKKKIESVDHYRKDLPYSYIINFKGHRQFPHKLILTGGNGTESSKYETDRIGFYLTWGSFDDVRRILGIDFGS